MRYRGAQQLICGLVLTLMPQAAGAGEITGRYAVHALGLKVGELVLSGTLEARRYTASSQFRTTGLAGAVARVRFVLRASGQRQGAHFLPESYQEDMNTGRRESQARLSYAEGIARTSLSGQSEIDEEARRGAVDPMTAMLMLLRDRQSDGLCDLRQRIFDGTRLSELRLTARRQSGDAVICSGSYRRLAGYSAEELQRRHEFPLQVHYLPEAGAMRAQRIRVETIYGPALLLRR